MNRVTVLQACDTVSQAVRSGIHLRETVLDFFVEAKRFEEDADADMGDTGHMIDLTVYHITVTHETLRELVMALDIAVRYSDSPFEALKKEITP